MSVNEYLSLAASLVRELGLTSYIIALAVVGVAIALLNRIMDR